MAHNKAYYKRGAPHFWGIIEKLKVFDIVMHTQSSYITAQLSQFFAYIFSIEVATFGRCYNPNEHHHTFYFFKHISNLTVAYNSPRHWNETMSKEIGLGFLKCCLADIFNLFKKIKKK